MGRQYKRREGSWNMMPCMIDGILYKSLFTLAIDFEFSYSTLRLKLAKRNGAPVPYSGHVVCTAEWFENHKDFDFKNFNPAGGKAGKEQ